METILNVLNLSNAEIVTDFAPNGITGRDKTIELSVLDALKRRPLTLDDIKTLTGRNVNELNKYLRTLEEKKLILRKPEKRGVFYTIAEPGL